MLYTCRLLSKHDVRLAFKRIILALNSVKQRPNQRCRIADSVVTAQLIRVVFPRQHRGKDNHKSTQ